MMTFNFSSGWVAWVGCVAVQVIQETCQCFSLTVLVKVLFNENLASVKPFLPDETIKGWQQWIETHPHVQISQIHLLSSLEASMDFPFPPATDPFLSFTIFNTGLGLLSTGFEKWELTKVARVARWLPLLGLTWAYQGCQVSWWWAKAHGWRGGGFFLVPTTGPLGPMGGRPL